MDREDRVLLLNTMFENREGFTWREYEEAQEARRELHLMGLLLERDFENMVRLNMIVKCPVTFDGVKNAKLIFGPDVTSLREKSMRRKLASVVKDYAEILREIIESLKDMEVLTDIMFINKLPFLVSTSLGLKFTTIEYLSSKNEIVKIHESSRCNS